MHSQCSPGHINRRVANVADLCPVGLKQGGNLDSSVASAGPATSVGSIGSPKTSKSHSLGHKSQVGRLAEAAIFVALPLLLQYLAVAYSSIHALRILSTLFSDIQMVEQNHLFFISFLNYALCVVHSLYRFDFIFPFLCLMLAVFAVNYNNRMGLHRCQLELTLWILRLQAPLPGVFGYRSTTQLAALHSPGRLRLADLILQLLASRPNTARDFVKNCRSLGLNVSVPCFHLGASAALAAKHNKMMHALNGNIMASDNVSTAAEPTSRYRSTPIPELGGVRPVLAETPVSSISPNLNKSWSPVLFPRQLTNTVRKLSGSITEFTLERESSFVRHFPKLMQNPRLPEFFTDTLSSIMAFPYRNGSYEHLLETDFQRPFPCEREQVPPLQTRFEGLGPVLAGSLDSDSLNAASRVMALNRFLDTRGNKQVLKWEAEAWDRWLSVANFASATSDTSNWLQPMSFS